MSFENSKHPRPDRPDEIAVWQTKAERTVELSNIIQQRAQEFAQQGILALYGAHLAAAEIGGAEVVLTRDDVTSGQTFLAAVVPRRRSLLNSEWIITRETSQ